VKVVDANNVMSLFEKSIAQLGTEEPGTTCNANDLWGDLDVDGTRNTLNRDKFCHENTLLTQKKRNKIGGTLWNLPIKLVELYGTCHKGSYHNGAEREVGFR